MKGGHEEESSSSTFPMGETAQEKGLSHVPECYVISTSHRPSLNPMTADVPLIDLSGLRGDTSGRCTTVTDIKNACCRYGFFQVINHGIDQRVVDEALSAASDFFNLPTKEKAKFMSNDVHKPIRYGTSLKDGVDKIQFWRVFLKHYAHRLEEWAKIWPQNPPPYSYLPTHIFHISL